MQFKSFPAAGFGRLALLGVALLFLAACQGSDGGVPKQLRPVPPVLVGKMSQLNMKATSPIFIRIFKESSEFEIWKQTDAGTYALLKTYSICKWSGALGPKKVEGDRQAPEGFYTVTPAQMNPNSSYYLSFNIGYPNSYDRSLGRTGSNLMVHGACSSSGCYSMTDEDAGEIFALARDSFRGGQRAFQIQALPFRMTPENMARHRDDPNMPFWQMLKVGYDTFELTHVPPKVDVCDHGYVFNADAGGASFDASAPCPAYTVPDTITAALARKKAADDQAMQIAAADLDAKAKQAEEDQARAAAAEAAAKEREAERANQPSFVSRMLAKVGMGGADEPAADAAPPPKVTASATPPKVTPPKPKVVASVPKPRARPEDASADATSTATASATVAPPAIAAVTPPATTTTASASTAAPVITPEMTPDIPKVGTFVKKKFLWDGDGSDDGSDSGDDASAPPL